MHLTRECRRSQSQTMESDIQCDPLKLEPEDCQPVIRSAPFPEKCVNYFRKLDQDEFNTIYECKKCKLRLNLGKSLKLSSLLECFGHHLLDVSYTNLEPATSSIPEIL